MERVALYAGSFDPITLGHLDIINRGLEVFDGLIVAVAHNMQKTPMFETEERCDLIRAAVGPEPRIQVESFDGLLVDYARGKGAGALLRGLRAVSDFEFEFQMACMNRKMAPKLHTVFMVASEEHFYVSSSLVKEVALLGGDVSAHVPAVVSEALRTKLGDR